MIDTNDYYGDNIEEQRGGEELITDNNPDYSSVCVNLSGPCAERARAVTGRRCPHSGVGQDFLPRRRVTLTKTAGTREQKVEKLIRRCQIERIAEGYKRYSKETDFRAEIRKFWHLRIHFSTFRFRVMAVSVRVTLRRGKKSCPTSLWGH